MTAKRISILGLFALVACCALIVSQALMYMQLRRANDELTRLRQRLQLIDVKDKQAVAALALPSTDPEVFRWAVRLSPEQAYVLKLSFGDIDKKGQPLPDNARVKLMDLQADPSTNETFVQFAVRPAEREYGRIELDVDGNKSMIAVAPPVASLFVGSTPYMQMAVGEKSRMVPIGQPIMLFMRRESNAGEVPRGLSLWLEAKDK